MPNFDGTIWNRMLHLGGTLRNSCLANVLGKIFDRPGVAGAVLQTAS